MIQTNDGFEAQDLESNTWSDWDADTLWDTITYGTNHLKKYLPSLCSHREVCEVANSIFKQQARVFTKLVDLIDFCWGRFDQTWTAESNLLICFGLRHPPNTCVRLGQDTSTVRIAPKFPAIMANIKKQISKWGLMQVI